MEIIIRPHPNYWNLSPLQRVNTSKCEAIAVEHRILRGVGRLVCDRANIWSCRSEIRTLRMKNHEFETTLGYVTRPCFKSGEGWLERWLSGQGDWGSDLDPAPTCQQMPVTPDLKGWRREPRTSSLLGLPEKTPAWGPGTGRDPASKKWRERGHPVPVSDLCIQRHMCTGMHTHRNKYF